MSVEWTFLEGYVIYLKIYKWNKHIRHTSIQKSDKNSNKIPTLKTEKFQLFRWFKFTLKPPYTVAHGHILLTIWDTSHWTSFVKFGLKAAWDISYDILWLILKYVIFRWFKFTLKPPYTIAHGNLSSAIWDTSHWTSFVKFGLKTAWDISYDILWPILKYVIFWQLQGRSSNLSKKDAFRKSIFSRWRSDEASTRLQGFRWAGP